MGGGDAEARATVEGVRACFHSACRTGDGRLPEWVIRETFKRLVPTLTEPSLTNLLSLCKLENGTVPIDGLLDTLFELPSAVSKIMHALPPLPRVVIIGSTSFNDPDSERVVKALGGELAASLSDHIVILTGGMKGVQETLVNSLGSFPESQLFHLVPADLVSGFSAGRDMTAGASLEERMQIIAQVGQIYISIEGGPGVAMEATVAFERGAIVLPLISSGGASSGMFNFPVGAMSRPVFATAGQWKCLEEKVEPEFVARAVVGIISKVLSSDKRFADTGVSSKTMSGAQADEGVATTVPVQEVSAILAPVESKLKVKIVSATGLRDTDWVGKSDPYCVCCLPRKPDFKFQTNVVNDNLNPEWNEEFIVEDCVSGDSLDFAIIDRDSGSNDDVLGRASLKSHVFLPSGFHGALPLSEAVGTGVLNVIIEVMSVAP